MSETRERIWDELNIELSEDERRDQWGDLSSTIGYGFSRRRDGTGGVTVSERWDNMDETWSAGISVTLPPRILAAFLEWVSKPSAPVIEQEKSTTTI